MTGFRVQAVLVAIVGATLLGFLAGYWVVVRDPTGVGASILAFPAIVAVMIGTVLLWAFSFALWATSRRSAPYLFVSSLILPIAFVVSPSLIRAWFY